MFTLQGKFMAEVMQSPVTLRVGKNKSQGIFGQQQQQQQINKAGSRKPENR